jgi:hypothetical protein
MPVLVQCVVAVAPVTGKMLVHDGSGQRHFFNTGKVRWHVVCA